MIASRRSYLLMGLLIAVLLLLTGCTEKATGPQNSPPIVDSISVSPQFVLPGGRIEVLAAVHDPEGDSLTYSWSTYPHAGRFFDSSALSTEMVVAINLKAGMMTKVILEVSDGKNSVNAFKWINIDTGLTIDGYIFYPGTKIPVPGVNVSVGIRADTSDSAGFYEIPSIAAQEYTLEAVKPDFEPFSRVINVSEDTTVDIQLNSTVYIKDISGFVQLIEGTGLENVRVTLLNPDWSPTEFSEITGSLGEYSLSGVPQGQNIFLIENAGNTTYDVLMERHTVEIDGETSFLNFRGKIRRIAFSSSGAAGASAWQFKRNDLWLPWYVDSANNCLRYDFCQPTDLGRIAMNGSVHIPADAGAVYWIMDMDLTEGACETGFYVDGIELLQGKYWGGTKEIHLNEPIPLSIEYLAGHNLAVEFFTWVQKTGICGDVRLKSFSLTYFR